MKRTILLVEDEDDLRDLLATELRDYDFDVIEASGGRDALEKLNVHRVDMIVTDLRMSGGTGLELLGAMQKREGHTIRTILMSGFADCTAQQAREMGANHLLHKPFGLEEFLRVVRTLFADGPA